MAGTEPVDVIVLGAGSAGEVAAGRAAGHGLSTVIVENELVGGECSYWACIPSKGLARPGELLSDVRRSPGLRSAVTGAIDATAALTFRDQLVRNWDDSAQLPWLENEGIRLVRGDGRLDGERTVTVTNGSGEAVRLEARRAVIVATGSRPNLPGIPGLAEARPWGSREATSAKRAPERLLVIGGGAVGSEMAQAWKRLGSREVTIVVGDRLLPRMEPFVGEELAAAFAEDGITVRTGVRLVGASRAGGQSGPVTASFDDGSEIVADEMLLATGRLPRTEGIGLDTVGLPEGKPIEVDDRLQAVGVAGGWLYAVGDVNGRNLLTHMGKYQGRIAADAIAGKDVTAWADRTAVPQVVFTDPQAAAVGVTEREARERGGSIRVVRYGIGDVAGASVLGEGVTGTSQLVVDADRRIIIGATFTGSMVAEMLHAASIAVAGQVPLEHLWHAVPVFPTVSEVWLGLLEAYGL